MIIEWYDTLIKTTTELGRSEIIVDELRQCRKFVMLRNKVFEGD